MSLSDLFFLRDSHIGTKRPWHMELASLYFVQKNIMKMYAPRIQFFFPFREFPEQYVLLPDAGAPEGLSEWQRCGLPKVMDRKVNDGMSCMSWAETAKRVGTQFGDIRSMTYVSL